MVKKYEKISFNLNVKYLKILDKIVEESDDFSTTRTTLLNEAVKEYVEQYIKHKEKGD